jgi:hypothetical protein
MSFNRDLPSLRLQLATALYEAAGCKEWPLCTEAGGCGDVYHLLPEVGLTFHPDERVDYRYPSIAPWEIRDVLYTIFTMTEYGGLREPNIFEGFLEIPQEIGELLEANNSAWREELQKIRDAKKRTSKQKISVIQFVSEMLEVALPDSYLELCPPNPDGSVEHSSFSSDTVVADTLNVEERLLLIDKLWIPDWSSPLPKSARRLIGLVLAAIDGRPYATPFVTVLSAYDRPMVECNVDVEKAFGFSEDEATRAFTAAVSSIFRLPGEANVPIPFDFNT